MFSLRALTVSVAAVGDFFCVSLSFQREDVNGRGEKRKHKTHKTQKVVVQECLK